MIFENNKNKFCSLIMNKLVQVIDVELIFR